MGRKPTGRAPGRPATVRAEVQVGVRVPAALLAAVTAQAQRDGISAAEAWRRAARAWLGLQEPAP